MEYRLGLYEKSMPSGLNWHEMLEAGRSAGFDQLEISIDETEARLARLEWTRAERMHLVRAMSEEDMPIRTMCLSGHRKYPLGSHDSATRAQSMKIMRRAIELASDLGIRIVQLAGYDVYYEEGDAQTRGWFMENLEKSVDCASKYGVTLGFETMETPFMDTISKGMAYVGSVNSPYLGMYPDLGNLTNACRLYASSVSREIGAGTGHMYAMHLKETEAGKYRNMHFGAGKVDFVSGIRDAWQCGVRLFTAEFWYDGGEDWRGRLFRSAAFLRECFERAGLSGSV